MQLCHGDRAIAEGRAVTLDCDVPEPVDFERATAWSKHYRGFTDHPLEHCFVCGPSRSAGDGLRIFAGRPSDTGPVAAPWIPDENLADEDGQLPGPVVWAAVDCPGYFAHALDTMALLGTMTGELLRPVRAGQRYVTMGWSRGQQGRKYLSGSALFTADGDLCARATQVWIVPRSS